MLRLGSWFHERPEGLLTKSSRDIMGMPEAYDLTGCAWSAVLAGCNAKTIARDVAVRDRGVDPYAVVRWSG